MEIYVALIAAAASILVAVLQNRDRKNLVETQKKVTETHRMVTVNHHTSDSPTLLDRLDDQDQLLKAVINRLDRHIEWHFTRK